MGKDRWGRKPKTYISVCSVSLCFQMTRGLGGFLKHRGTEAQREEEGEGGGRGEGEVAGRGAGEGKEGVGLFALLRSVLIDPG